MQFSLSNRRTLTKVVSEYDYVAIPDFILPHYGPNDLVIVYLGSRSPPLFDRSIDTLRKYTDQSTPLIFMVDYGGVQEYETKTYISNMDLKPLKKILDILNPDCKT